MDWGSLFSSIVPTIGQVVGSLLGVKSIEDGILYYSHRMVKGSDESFSTQIFCQNGDYYLANQSCSQQDKVTLSFPQMGKTGTQTLVIPSFQRCKLTQLFHDEAVRDNSKFLLTASSIAQKQGPNGQLDGCIITESCSQIPVDGEQRRVGSYLNIQVQPQQIILTPRDSQLSLLGVPLLSIQNSGDTGMRLSDIQSQNGQVVASLPQQLPRGQQISVEVMAQMQTEMKLEQFVANDAYAHLRTPLDEDIVERLKKAPRLNWK